MTTYKLAGRRAGKGGPKEALDQRKCSLCGFAVHADPRFARGAYCHICPGDLGTVEEIAAWKTMFPKDTETLRQRYAYKPPDYWPLPPLILEPESDPLQSGVFLVEKILEGLSSVAYSGCYISLHTGCPGPSGQENLLVSGGGFLPVSLAATSTGGLDLAPGSPAPCFAMMSPATISYVSAWSSTYKLLWWTPLDYPVTVVPGDTLTLTNVGVTFS